MEPQLIITILAARLGVHGSFPPLSAWAWVGAPGVQGLGLGLGQGQVQGQGLGLRLVDLCSASHLLHVLGLPTARAPLPVMQPCC